MSPSVLELPQTWQKPTFQDLRTALQGLRLEPPIWNYDESPSEAGDEDEKNTKEDPAVTAYLNNIIRSQLTWIPDEDNRDQIWSLASKCVSERCGRTAMGEITRRWPFEGFELVIREPPLTGDNVGFKTWGSAYALGKKLASLGVDYLPSALAGAGSSSTPSVLELGSGTGLLGLAAACVWKTQVMMTDLPEIMSNLEHNVQLNDELLRMQGGRVTTSPLTWGDEDAVDRDLSIFGTPHQYKVIVAADVLYDDHQPPILAQTIHRQLSLATDAVVFVSMPLRDAASPRLRSAFVERMAAMETGLTCVASQSITGRDDWGPSSGGASVEMWLGVFRRLAL